LSIAQKSISASAADKTLFQRLAGGGWLCARNAVYVPRVLTFADFWISVLFRPSALGIPMQDIRATVGFASWR
jgi:hypothetical protein